MLQVLELNQPWRVMSPQTLSASLTCSKLSLKGIEPFTWTLSVSYSTIELQAPAVYKRLSSTVLEIIF